MKKILRRIPVILLTLALLTALLPVSAFAGTKTLNAQEFTTYAEEAGKSAKRVKEGRFKLIMPSTGSGYLKFTAPSTDRYYFSFSNLKSKYRYDCGYICLMKVEGTEHPRLIKKKVRTQGGRAQDIELATKADTSGELVSRHLKSRYAKVNLTMGQTIYLYFSFLAEDSLILEIY